MKHTVLLSLFILFLSLSVRAANFDLASVPPFLGDSVEPNVFYMLDDSTSMDWEILTKKHWPYCYYNPDDNKCSGGTDSDLVDNGLMKLYAYNSDSTKRWEGDFIYIYYDSDYSSGPSCKSSKNRNSVEKCVDWYGSGYQTEIDKEWRLRSASVNVLYYNPEQEYLPWEGKSDAVYSDISRIEPFTYYVFKGTGVPGWDELDNNNVDTFKVTSTGMTKNGSSITEDDQGRSLAEVQQNIANWYQYYRKRIYVTKAAVAKTVTQSPSNRYGLATINKYNSWFVEVPAVTDVAPFISHNTDNVIDALYNDYKADGGTPLRKGLQIAGKYYDDDLSGKSDPIISECQQNFTILFTDGYWNGSDPGLGDEDGDSIDDTLADMAKKYYDKDLSSLANSVIASDFDPATWQHMVTFGVAFGANGKLSDSDGSGWPDSGGSDLGESDNWGDAFAGDAEKIDDLWHATYNSRGSFVQADTPDAVVKALEEAITSIASRSASASAVSLNAAALASDTMLYQAKFDSGGWYGELLAYSIISELDPAQPDKKIGDLDQLEWNAKSVLDAKSYDDRVILTYNRSEASGVAFRWPDDYNNLQNDELSQDQVNALLNTYSGSDPATYGQQVLNYLRGDDTYEGSSNIPRDNRVSKLGDIINSGTFLVQKPGFRYPDDWTDISKATVSSTNTSEPEDSVSYSDFVTAKKDRSQVLYVGANDGMLHGFFAEKDSRNSHQPGEELIAYVPDKVFKNLYKLTLKPYEHLYFVDSSPVVGDVLYDGAWHSVLVSGLGAGGQGVFALDVTDPDSFSESNAADIVLWEFTDENDEDMGYSFSQPSIVRLHNGKWAAVFGNGYNNTESDSYVSADNDGVADNSSQGDEGQAVLYIVDIKDGSLIKKFETKVGISHASSISPHPTGSASLPNGLSTPAVVDIDNDHIADYVYAGDLYGNLWKFDIRDSDPGNWEIAFSGKPLFTACEADPCTDSNHQPITTRPQVGFHPTSAGYLIYFGTGKFFEEDDNTQTNQKTQTFYGIWDKGSNWSAFGRDDLLQQKILKEVNQQFDIDSNGDGTNDSTVTYDLRVTSQKVVDWSSQNGWYLDLVNYNMDTYDSTPTNTNNYGERIISDPILRNNKIIFSTLIPPANSCEFGGDGWLMELDAVYGGRLDYSPFDLNQDDKFFNPDDFVNVGDIDGDGTDDYMAPSGKKSKNGIGAKPGILAVGETEFKYSAGSDGSIEKTVENPGPSGHGRQSWNELL